MKLLKDGLTACVMVLLTLLVLWGIVAVVGKILVAVNICGN